MNVKVKADKEMVRKLESLVELHRIYERELQGCPEGYMTRTKSSEGSFYYKATISQAGRRISRGITHDKEKIFGYARKRFLMRMVEILEENIQSMRVLMKTYSSFEPRDVIDSLPPVYSDLPAEAFCCPEGRKQNRRSENPYYLQHLKHTTLDGFKVRSKSELYIGAQLDRYKISYQYEAMLRLGGHIFYPDFVTHNVWTNEPIYWEHCGLVTDEGYMADHYKKLSVYAEHGIVPWKNLILTYDDEEGNLSAVDIDNAIKSLLMKIERKHL